MTARGKDAKPTAITANRLADGAVVYLTEDGGWSQSLRRAAILHTDEEKTASMALADRAIKDRLVVEPYQIDVDTKSAEISAHGTRERIRASGGPSVAGPTGAD